MTFQGNNSVIELNAFRKSVSDASLVSALKAGQPGTGDELFERYAGLVRRILIRVMGPDQELPDLINEVFHQALRSIQSLEDGSKLSAWLIRVTIFVARRCIRGRNRKRWLLFKPPEEISEIGEVVEISDEGIDLLNAVQRVFTEMPVEHRILFALRYFEEMELKELAHACDCSLSTAKRRLKKSESLFKTLAQHHPVLRERLDRDAKWRTR